MASSIAPNIVENGLMLYLDASNSKSYSGTGSNWFDLSRQNYDSTLINAPVYNNDNAGSITFDGTNDSCLTGLTQNSSNFSFECVFKFNDISGTKVVVGKHTGVGDDYWMGSDGTNIVFVINQTILSSGIGVTLNQIQSVTCVLGTSLRQIWINGELKNSTATTTCNPNGNLVLADFGLISGYFTAVDIYSFKFYNREISVEEIRNNFESTRTRFGI